MCPLQEYWQGGHDVGGPSTLRHFLEWYWGIRQRATNGNLVPTCNICSIFGRNLQQIEKSQPQHATISFGGKFMRQISSNLAFWLSVQLSVQLSVLPRKRVIWQPATNSFWQLATNSEILSISATNEKNVAPDTFSKYPNFPIAQCPIFILDGDDWQMMQHLHWLP